MKYKYINILKSLRTFLVWSYVILMLAGFPFYFQRDYADLTAAKSSFFQISSLVFLVLLGLLGICSYLCHCLDHPRKTLSFSGTDLFALAFGLVVLISSLTSPVGAEAFWGKEGRKMGGVFLLLCIAVYFAISRYFEDNQWVLWLFFLSTLLVWIVVVCNFWDIDILQMRRHLAHKQKTDFLGTLGNININACYSSLMISLMQGFYFVSKKRLHQILFFGASVLGIYVCFCTASDSWLLAFGGSMVVLLMISMGKTDAMIRWIHCIAAILCAGFAMRLTVIFGQLLPNCPKCILNFQKQRLLYPMTDFRVLLAGFAILLASYGIIKSPAIHFLKKYGNKIVTTLLGISVLGVISAIFPMKDRFGTNRGYIWKRTLANFRELPIWQKLFGYGPNCFLQSMEERFGAQMRRRYHAPFLDAHNEALQMLAVTGIFGVISYMGMQASLLLSCVKKQKEEKFAIPGLLGITAYLFQGLVNNPSVFTTPLYFLFLAILENRLRRRKACS